MGKSDVEKTQKYSIFWLNFPGSTLTYKGTNFLGGVYGLMKVLCLHLENFHNR